ncbi:MAG: hypothetical protein J5657_00445 [Clostridiales bacterium]|nr:hypothetical protein [Clostridiales bacterium]
MLISCRDRKLDFTIEAPPSKSIFHRELIVRFLLGAKDGLADDEGDNDDIRATKACLRALSEGGSEVVLPCNESGSTLRFMIPVAAAYLLNEKDVKAERLIFETKGRLFDRPLKELEDALSPHGITISRDDENRRIIVTGAMTGGEFVIDGSVSSQYISGLLMALPLFDSDCSVKVTGGIRSRRYIDLTLDVLDKYGLKTGCEENVFTTHPAAGIRAPEGGFKVEGDWSNGAFLLCIAKFSDIKVTGLDPDSHQGDREILDFLAAESENVEWDCSDIPDITPYMAVVAAFVFDSALFTGISRLRIKESDRVKAVREQLGAIGVVTEETEDSLVVYKISGEAKKKLPDVIRLSSYHDHRMAMTAVLIAVILKTMVEIDDIECMNKSFPEFPEIVRREMMP